MPFVDSEQFKDDDVVVLQELYDDRCVCCMIDGPRFVCFVSIGLWIF